VASVCEQLNTAELQRAYEQRTSWRQLKVGECPVCGQSKAQDKHTGSSFDSFLAEEGILAEVEAVALDRVRQWQDGDWWLEELALLAEATLL
jgi:hypothetical protein